MVDCRWVALVTGHIGLSGIDDALDGHASRDGARRVITFDRPGTTQVR